MGTGQRLVLIVAVMMLPARYVAAQALPWPTDQPRAASPAPWPSDPPQPAGAAPWPGDRAPSASRMPAPAMSPMGAPPPQASPFGGGGGTPPPCMAEFAKLRDDVQKQGLAAKAAGKRKVSREEMCKHITAYSVAELKWVKYSEANVKSCGIPAEVVSQLKQVHNGTEQTKEKICAAGPTAAPPSLHDALGTERLPTPGTTKLGNGTLDTLTGPVIQR